MKVEMIFEDVGVEDNGAGEWMHIPKIKLQYHWSPPPIHDGLQCFHDQKSGTIENLTTEIDRPMKEQLKHQSRLNPHTLFLYY